MTVRGSCLCREIAWEVAGELELMSHCHCSMCRKAHGSAFATYVMAGSADVSWPRGRELPRLFESSPGFWRAFCPTCGSVVASPGGEHVGMPAGCLDDDPRVRPLAHVFVGSKAPWHEIHDELPRFAEYPPGYGETIKRPEPPPPASEDVVRGSCLCGGAAFEIDRPLEPIKNCHCSRCRKAAGAAHDSILLARRSAFRWSRGEDLVESFKLPGARFFFVAFCRVCGSNLPVSRPQSEHVGVPAGVLDDDPGSRQSHHIFVGSKAPWFEISDALPQFDEYPPEGWTPDTAR